MQHPSIRMYQPPVAYSMVARERGDTSVEQIILSNRHVGTDEESPRTKLRHEEAKVLATTEERNKKKSDKLEQEFQRLKSLVVIPYLPPIPQFLLSSQPIYTLVLDLDETLIHLECDDEEDEDGKPTEHEDGVYYLIRPGTIRFLNELSKYYEIVIFTAAMPDVSVT